MPIVKGKVIVARNVCVVEKYSLNEKRSWSEEVDRARSSLEGSRKKARQRIYAVR